MVQAACLAVVNIPAEHASTVCLLPTPPHSMCEVFQPFAPQGAAGIPIFGFGCASTRDHSLFHFKVDGTPCSDLPDIVSRYKRLVPAINSHSKGSIVPAVRHACTMAASTQQFQVMVAITDEAVLSELAQRQLVRALAEASRYPVAVIHVGVGDGDPARGFQPMQALQKALKSRRFDNYTFVELNKFNDEGDEQECAAEFVHAALRKLPKQRQFANIAKLLSDCPLPPTPAVPVLPAPSKASARNSRTHSSHEPLDYLPFHKSKLRTMSSLGNLDSPAADAASSSQTDVPEYVNQTHSS